MLLDIIISALVRTSRKVSIIAEAFGAMAQTPRGAVLKRALLGLHRFGVALLQRGKPPFRPTPPPNAHLQVLR